MNLEEELRVASELARRAGAHIHEIKRGGYAIGDKEGGEPVTDADLASSRIIVQGLKEAFPVDTVVSEEAEGHVIPAEGRCWVVDPLDGTQDFIDDTGDFVVMIGLCVDGRPVLGAVHHPPEDRLYVGGPGLGLRRFDGESPGPLLTMTSPASLSALRLVASRSHRDAYLDEAKARLGITGEDNRGSVGLKVTLLAAGQYDLYLHRRGLKVWDTCAPEALLLAAGGRMGTLGGEPLSYAGTVRHEGGMLAAHASVFDEVARLLGGTRDHDSMPR
ncbi:MAG: 3'(2'),5'-bisphosphate nucleotidase CysQ [Polyangia bacterium]|jgi:3'(2'), 5'-bisphosphate nucleotidase|nr:3'(2'),5'-bisphosphate nucleotidase CysQ [Polyangia bacterium]